MANLYPDEASILRILADSGIDSARIVLNSTAANNWHSALAEAEKIGRVDVLLDIVGREYGSNQEFRNACDIYRQSINRTGRSNADLELDASHPVLISFLDMPPLDHSDPAAQKLHDLFAVAYASPESAKYLALSTGILASVLPTSSDNMSQFWWRTMGAALDANLLRRLVEAAAADRAKAGFRPRFEAILKGAL